MLKDISDLEAGDQKVLGISCDFTKGERVVVTDLTKEHPNKTLWRFLLPMMLSVMFQQIYNIADSMIAGKFQCVGLVEHQIIPGEGDAVILFKGEHFGSGLIVEGAAAA